MAAQKAEEDTLVQEYEAVTETTQEQEHQQAPSKQQVSRLYPVATAAQPHMSVCLSVSRTCKVRIN